MKRILLTLQRALLVIGASLLGWCAFVEADAWLFQARQGRDLDAYSHQATVARSGAAPRAYISTPPAAPRPSDGGLVGRLAIDRLGLSAIVIEGVSPADLRRAIGHIPGTALPGEDGNIALAGHRDTFFQALEDIRVDDLITLTTPAGEYRYRVTASAVVSPDAVEVLDQTRRDVLTLVTCYPFHWAGPAPNRFVVRAVRV